MNSWVELTKNLTKKIAERSISLPESVEPYSFHNETWCYLRVDGATLHVKNVKHKKPTDTSFPIAAEVGQVLTEILEADLADAESTQNKSYYYRTVEFTEELKEQIKAETGVNLDLSPHSQGERIYMAAPDRYTNQINFNICRPGDIYQWPIHIKPSEKLATFIEKVPSHKVTWY